MSLLERIHDDVKEAMKAHDTERADIIRFLVAQLQNKAIENRASHKSEELSDEEVLQVLQREAKKRKEAIELYTKGDRSDLAAKEGRELAFLMEYLPREMTRAEIVAVIEQYRARGVSGFAPLVKAVMGELKGRADGKVVSETIKELLG